MKVLNFYDNGPARDGQRYIGRGSPWGNPFKMNSGRNRQEVVRQFENYARKRVQVEPQWLRPLLGHDLVCYCYPKLCHGNVLVKLCEEVYD